jgi:uncharacterized protein YkwD
LESHGDAAGEALMRERNPIYNDYRRRREREKWRKRLPMLLAIVAALVVVAAVGSVVLPQLQEQPMARLTPSPQVTLVASPTPAMMVVLPSATVEPTTTAIPATAMPVPTQAPLATQPLPPSTNSGQAVKGSMSFDVPALQRLMLDLINADRQANGLSAVAWDEGAAQAATAHAEDMAAQGYFSHWNTKGWGPDVRYGLAGGTDVIKENVASQWRRYDDGRPAPIDDWSEVVREAQTGLMNSPGHRANILDPFHTHVGIGIAYNAQTGETRIAQEFINRYVALDGAPVSAGNSIELSWALLNGASEPLINVAYEPMPKPLSPNDLNNRMPRTYQSPAEIIDVMRPEVQSDGRYFARVPLGQQGAGLYHIRIWVKLNGEQVPAANVMLSIGTR